MSNKEKRKSSLPVTNCLICGDHYFHSGFGSERRNGVTLRSGKRYCLFPKKPVKLDSRKRHMEIPADCPRHNVPIRFTVYALKKRATAADSGAGNAARYWRTYAGNLDMVTKWHLFGGGSYTDPDSKDGFLWDNGERVHKLQTDDVVVREDGFTMKAWRWNVEYFLSAFDFDETGIKKKPERKGEKPV